MVVSNAIDVKDWIVPHFEPHSEFNRVVGIKSLFSLRREIKDDIERKYKANLASQIPVIGGAKFDGIFSKTYSKGTN